MVVRPSSLAAKRTGTQRDVQVLPFAERIERAVVLLGSGLLSDPRNGPLRRRLRRSQELDRLFHGLLRFVHRTVWLLEAEALHLLDALTSREARAALGLPRPQAEPTLAVTLAAPLAALLGDPLADPLSDPVDPAPERWHVLRALFCRLGDGSAGLPPPLGGVFRTTSDCLLGRTELGDAALSEVLAVLGACAEETAAPCSRAQARRTAVPFEQLGRAYELLLERQPVVDAAGQRLSLPPPHAKAHSRRRRGSYYTPERLVQKVLDGALEPLVQETLSSCIEQDASTRAERLLELRLVDPACGSGHFLVAAARALARHVADLRREAGDAAGSELALREVVQRCVFGVDLDPLAVELCCSALWFEAKTAGLSLDDIAARVRLGNALLGAEPVIASAGPPDTAWQARLDNEKGIARELRRKNRSERESSMPLSLRAGSLSQSRRALDGWCAAFFAPHDEFAPTHALWRTYATNPRNAGPTALGIERLSEQHRFFHWPLAFSEVFERGGFDLVLGNPPWIAHAGRAAQALPSEQKSFFQHNYEAFGDYPTTHGLFISVAARALRPGGALGLVIPSSVSELAGYAPTRRAHDRLCEVYGELEDFGEGQFEGVTQPCMALISRRSAGRSADALGEPWPLFRPDLDASSRALLERLSRLPQLPAQLFGERGLQSDRALRPHFTTADAPLDRFTTAVREGSDVREFELLAPRIFVDRAALGPRMRSDDEFARVSVLVRQTARYPIAALSDGQAFRNSLLAVFESPQWPAPVLVALLNSSLIRWLHFARFRDARQPILPQLKVAHLRAIPGPPVLSDDDRTALTELGERLSQRCLEQTQTRRAELDALVHRLYGLGPAEAQRIDHWHAALQREPRARRRSLAAQ